MAVCKDKTRTTITLSREQLGKLDAYAVKLGMNRSALCAYFIGQGLLSLDKAFGIVDDFSDKLLDKMAETALEGSPLS